MSIERYGIDQIIGIWEIDEDLEILEEGAAGLPDSPPLDISHVAKLQEWYVTRILTAECCRQLGMDYRGIEKDEYGKPWLSQSHSYLSVTHCYPLVAVIIDRMNPVGIDLERHRNQIRRISHRFMSDEELSHRDEAEYLLICWTAKEALYKLHGRRSLEFRKQLLIDPFKPAGAGTIYGTILDGGEERHEMYYRFIRDNEYVILHSVS